MNDQDSMFTQAFIDNVCNDLEQNRLVRYSFLSWGRLHIDRRLPFICIYRRPIGGRDLGTEQLLLGQASYILVDEEDAASKGFIALLNTIMKIFTKAFGSCLLFELWSEEPSTNKAVKSELKAMPAVFKITTSKNQAPHVVLEELEKTLLEIPFEHRACTISLKYAKQCCPALMFPFLVEQPLSKNPYFWIGLSTSPIYRKDEKLLPFILRKFHRYLTHALKRTFYAFTRCYTTHRPVHFHELGRRTITKSVTRADIQLAQIKEQFDILFHVTPVNCEEAWMDFERNGFTKPPVFNYRSRQIDPDLLKRQLFNIPIEQIEDPTLAYIFQTQREEINRLLTMINDRNHANFLYGSMQVFGGVEPWLLELANEILDKVHPDYSTRDSTYLTSKEFAVLAEKCLSTYRKSIPGLTSQIEIRDDVPGILVSRGNLLIGRQIRFTVNTAEATLAHEIGTHIVTYANGKTQPFHQFYSGLANYEPLQEGLAVFSEYLVGKLKPHRLRTLSARVVAVHSLIEGANFLDVFRQLRKDFDLTAYNAYYITMRVFRGGGYTKDAIYLKGLSHLLDYLAKGKELTILYLGKIAQENIPLVDELRWRKILSNGPLIPHYLTSQTSQERLERARQGISVIDLIEEN